MKNLIAVALLFGTMTLIAPAQSINGCRLSASVGIGTASAIAVFAVLSGRTSTTRLSDPNFSFSKVASARGCQRGFADFFKKGPPVLANFRVADDRDKTEHWTSPFEV